MASDDDKNFADSMRNKWVWLVVLVIAMVAVWLMVSG